MATCDPNTLAADAVGLSLLSKRTLLAIIAQQLCVLNGGSSPTACAAQSGDASPIGAVTPEFVGQLYNQNNGEAFFYSTGLTSADWTEITSGGSALIETVPAGNEQLFGIFAFGDVAGVTGLIWNGTTTAAGFDLGSDSALQTVSFPNLLTIDPTNSQGGYIALGGATALLSISAPLLQTVAGGVAFNSCPSLTTVNFTSLTTCGGSMSFHSCTSLVSVSLPAITTTTAINAANCSALTSFSAPNFLPSNTSAINFQNDALSVASVDHILARCVANAAYVAGTVSLNGGTNATPSVAGLVDKATLIGRGVTVNTN